MFSNRRVGTHSYIQHSSYTNIALRLHTSIYTELEQGVKSCLYKVTTLNTFTW